MGTENNQTNEYRKPKIPSKFFNSIKDENKSSYNKIDNPSPKWF